MNLFYKYYIQIQMYLNMELGCFSPCENYRENLVTSLLLGRNLAEREDSSTWPQGAGLQDTDADVE